MENVVNVVPEFSQIIDVPNCVKSKKGQVRIEAKKEECAKLAERFGYDAISHLSLEGEITPQESTDMYNFKGVLKSSVTLHLEHLQHTENVEEIIEVIFAPNNSMIEERMEEIDFDIEPMEFGKVDLGELAAQYLFLLLDSILFDDHFKNLAVSEHDEEKENPFSKLEKLLEK
jgi:hypothetical protein